MIVLERWEAGPPFLPVDAIAILADDHIRMFCEGFPVFGARNMPQRVG